MRTLGFSLLLLGFILLCFFVGQTKGPIPRVVVSKYYDKIEKEPKGKITKETARLFVLNAVDDSIKHSSKLFIPGLMMLSGGLLLAYCPKKKQISKSL